MQLTKDQGIALNNYINDYVNNLDNSSQSQKDDIASAIKDSINSKMNYGMTLNEALSELDVVSITKRIIKENDKPNETVVVEEEHVVRGGALRFTLTTLLMIPTWILGGIVGLVSAAVAIVALALFFAPVYGAFAFAIYDLGPALGIFFFILAAAPIIIFILYFVFGALWELLKLFINFSAKCYKEETTIPDTLENINFLRTGMKANWKILGALGLFFGLMFAGSAAGTIAPKTGVIGGAIRDGYVHEQVIDITKDQVNKDNDKAIQTVVFENLWSHKSLNYKDLFEATTITTPVAGKEPTVNDDTIRIHFFYNTKHSDQKITPIVKKEGTVLRIRFDYPDIEPMMNVKGYGFKIEFSGGEGVESIYNGANFIAYALGR